MNYFFVESEIVTTIIVTAAVVIIVGVFASPSMDKHFLD